MDDVPAAYLAGFFDGEGNIRVDSTSGLVNGKRYLRYSLRLNLKQVDPRPLNVFAVNFGGTVRLVNRNDANPNWRPIHEWNANSKRAYALLKFMRPHLIVKAEQADLGMAFQEMLDSRDSRRTYPLSDEERATRVAFAEKIAALSHRTYEGIELVVGDGTARHFANLVRPKLPKLKRSGKFFAKPRGTRRNGPRQARPSEEALRRDYEDLGPVQTAQKYGVVVTTVFNWMAHYGIPKLGVTEKTRQRFSAAQQKSYDEYKDKLWGADLKARAKKRPGRANWYVPDPPSVVE